MRDAGLDVSIHYAVKANDHLAMLSLVGREGHGADIVSGGELARTQKAGIQAGRVVFSGVGKTDAELEQAIALDIGQINIESAEELDIISAIATRLGRIARVTLRVNPDVDAKTHAKITTGLAANKFGIPFDDAAACMPARPACPVSRHAVSLHISAARSCPPALTAPLMPALRNW